MEWNFLLVLLLMVPIAFLPPAFLLLRQAEEPRPSAVAICRQARATHARHLDSHGPAVD